MSDNPDMVEVPRVPTKAMIDAGSAAILWAVGLYGEFNEWLDDEEVVEIWKAMIEAFPHER